MAPEYLVRGQLTDKADVYAFGVMVLEIVSGRKNRVFAEGSSSILYAVRFTSLVHYLIGALSLDNADLINRKRIPLNQTAWLSFIVNKICPTCLMTCIFLFVCFLFSYGIRFGSITRQEILLKLLIPS